MDWDGLEWIEIPQSPVCQHQKVSKEGGRLLSQVNVVKTRVEELGNINETKIISSDIEFSVPVGRG